MTLFNCVWQAWNAHKAKGHTPENIGRFAYRVYDFVFLDERELLELSNTWDYNVVKDYCMAEVERRENVCLSAQTSRNGS